MLTQVLLTLTIILLAVTCVVYVYVSNMKASYQDTLGTTLCANLDCVFNVVFSHIWQHAYDLCNFMSSCLKEYDYTWCVETLHSRLVKQIEGVCTVNQVQYLEQKLIIEICCDNTCRQGYISCDRTS